MRVYRDEIFGPVSVIEPFETWEHALELAGPSPLYGLQASVCTRDIGRALSRSVISTSKGVLINEPATLRVDNYPMQRGAGTPVSAGKVSATPRSSTRKSACSCSTQVEYRSRRRASRLWSRHPRAYGKIGRRRRGLVDGPKHAVLIRVHEDRVREPDLRGVCSSETACSDINGLPPLFGSGRAAPVAQPALRFLPCAPGARAFPGKRVLKTGLQKQALNAPGKSRSWNAKRTTGVAVPTLRLKLRGDQRQRVVREPSLSPVSKVVAVAHLRKRCRHHRGRSSTASPVRRHSSQIPPSRSAATVSPDKTGGCHRQLRIPQPKRRRSRRRRA